MMAISAEEAASYANRSGLQQEMGTKLMKMTTIKEGSTVLDLGCGTGYLTKVLSEKVGPEGKVVAIDPDGERLKIAKQKYSATNIEYIQADDQTFPSMMYDLVFANQVIHWIPDQRATLKRVYDNLSTGGEFAFTTDIDDGSREPRELYDLMDKLLGQGKFEEIFRNSMKYLSAEEYKKLATEYGYLVTSMETEARTHEWQTLDDIIDTAQGWLQGAIDPSKLDRETVQELREECEGKSGPALQIARTYLYVILRK